MPKMSLDALQLKRDGAAAVQARLSAMTPEQQQQFWHERTRALIERQHAKRAERAAGASIVS